jgi:hypothetical protein
MPDGAAEGRWLTYDEIATVRGTQRVGAIRWVQRRKWRRQPGNDGLVRVLVPPDALPTTLPPRRSAPTVTHDVTPDSAAAFTAALAAIEAAHAGEVAVLRAQVEALTSRAERAEAEITEAEKDRDMAIATQNRALTEVAAMRRAEALRRAAGLRQRLRTAWRGE